MATNKENFALDGAPKSNIRMSQKRHPLIEITFKDTANYGSGSFKIAAKDFDKSKHKKVTKRAALKSAEEPKPELSTHSEADLLTMTRDALMKVPEYSLISKPSEVKEDLVAQILAAREAAG